jgi:hypothetical protein
MALLQQGRRWGAANSLPTAGGTGTAARSLEQRVLELEKKVEALQKELERSRRGRGTSSSTGGTSGR